MAEQLLDLVFYMLIGLGGYRQVLSVLFLQFDLLFCQPVFRFTLVLQEDHAPNHMDLMSSTLVACNLYLLTGFLSPQWQEMVPVLLEHPKVQIHLNPIAG